MNQSKVTSWHWFVTRITGHNILSHRHKVFWILWFHAKCQLLSLFVKSNPRRDQLWSSPGRTLFIFLWQLLQKVLGSMNCGVGFALPPFSYKHLFQRMWAEANSNQEIIQWFQRTFKTFSLTTASLFPDYISSHLKACRAVWNARVGTYFSPNF